MGNSIVYGLELKGRAKLLEIIKLAGEANPEKWAEAYCTEAEHKENTANMGVFRTLNDSGTRWEVYEVNGDSLNGRWGPGWVTVGGYHCTMSTGPWALYFAKQSTYGQFDE